MSSGLQRLQRHQLVRLTPEGWASVQSGPGDREPRSQAALAHWAAHDLPLVVTRQGCGDSGGQIALGLPTPTCWGRLRLALSVPAAALRDPHGFPAPAAITPLLAPEVREAWTALAERLAALGVAPQVYGGHGWQAITGLRYLRDGSDLDLWLPVRDAGQADGVAAVLCGGPLPSPPPLGEGARPAARQPVLDGELGFPDGAAVAWREWRQWRAGRVDAVLVKRLDGVRLERDARWLPRT